MNIINKLKFSRVLILLIVCMLQTSCIVGTIAGAAVKTTVAVVKIPIKVGAKVIKAVIPGDSDEKDDK